MLDIPNTFAKMNEECLHEPIWSNFQDVLLSVRAYTCAAFSLRKKTNKKISIYLFICAKYNSGNKIQKQIGCAAYRSAGNRVIRMGTWQRNFSEYTFTYGSVS